MTDLPTHTNKHDPGYPAIETRGASTTILLSYPAQVDPKMQTLCSACHVQLGNFTTAQKHRQSPNLPPRLTEWGIKPAHTPLPRAANLEKPLPDNLRFPQQASGPPGPQ